MWYKVKKIYVWTTKVRPAIPIPTSWLLWYRPLQTNLNDASGNGNNGSWYSGTGSFWTVGWKNGAVVTRLLDSTWNASTQHIVTSLQYNWPTITMIWWIYLNSITLTWWWRPWLMNNSQTWNSYFTIWNRQWDNWYIYTQLPTSSTSHNQLLLESHAVASAWELWCLTVSWSQIKFYRNWTLINTTSSSTTSSANGSYWRLWCGQKADTQVPTSPWWWTDWYIRHCAVYNRALTDNEVLQFYNLTQ